MCRKPSCGRVTRVLQLSVWLATVVLACSAPVAGQKATTVSSGKEFFDALRDSVSATIIISEHLDLREFLSDRAAPQSGPAVTTIFTQAQIVIQGKCKGTVENSTELAGVELDPPLPPLGRQHKEQQCVVVVNSGLFEFRGISRGIWLDNLMIALRRGAVSTVGHSMQLLSFHSTDTWLTDVTLSGDAWVARALLAMHDARLHAQGCVISGFKGARASGTSPPAQPPSAVNADDLPDIVADENYAEYDLQGDALMQWGGEAPVAQVHHNSSLVLEECLIEGNIVRHEGGAAIAITAEADSDYDASDFPCSIAVRGSVVHSSFSPSNESSRVLFVTTRAAAGGFYTDVQGAQVLDLETGKLFEPKSSSAVVGPFDAVMLRASDNPLQGGARCPLCRSPSPDPLLMDSTETTLSGAVDSTGGSKQGLQLWVIALVASILVVLVVVLGGYIVWQQRRSSKAQSKSDHSTKASRALKRPGSVESMATALRSATPFWETFNRGPEAGRDLERALNEVLSNGTPLWEGYKLLEGSQRHVGGHGVVQFAALDPSTTIASAEVECESRQGIAAKFYLNKNAFANEQYLHCATRLQPHMPATLSMHVNSDDRVKAPGGYVFPPFVVMKCGQTLEHWAHDHPEASFVEKFDVLYQVAEALKALHAAGYAHRNLKPSNIVRCTGSSAWSFLDFGCAARIGAGESSRLSHSMAYAAPEMIVAAEASKRSVVVDAAVDVWAMGLMTVEMVSGEKTFPELPEPPSQNFAEAERVSRGICDCLSGRKDLPWEGCGLEAKRMIEPLRSIKRTVLKCLSRDPHKRPTAVQLLHAWENIFDNVQMHGADWLSASASSALPSRQPGPSLDRSRPQSHTPIHMQSQSREMLAQRNRGVTATTLQSTQSCTSTQQLAGWAQQSQCSTAMPSQQLLGGMAAFCSLPATAALNPPEVLPEQRQADNRKNTPDTTPPVEMFQVCVARPGSSQHVPGWRSGPIFSSPPPIHPYSAAVGTKTQPVAGRHNVEVQIQSRAQAGDPAKCREIQVEASCRDSNGVMHASEAAQAAVEAAAHEAHARVSQPAEPPVLVQVSYLAVTSGHNSSTDASKNKTSSRGASKVFSRGQRSTR